MQRAGIYDCFNYGYFHMSVTDPSLKSLVRITSAAIFYLFVYWKNPDSVSFGKIQQKNLMLKCKITFFKHHHRINEYAYTYLFLYGGRCRYCV